MQTRHITWTAGFAAVIAALASLPTPTQPSEQRLGFTPIAFARKLEHEARYSASITATAISNAHRALTERPHRSGTDGARVVAEHLRDELNRAGLEVEMPEYLAYLSGPRSIIDVARDLPAPRTTDLSEASRAATRETLYDNWRTTERRRQGSSADAEVELSALGSGGRLRRVSGLPRHPYTGTRVSL